MGVIVRKGNEHDPASHAPATSSPASSSRTVSPVIGPIDLSWDLQGDLTPGELFALPPGARRTAEFTLWSLHATPEEHAQYWDQALALGKDDMWGLDQIMTAWVRRFPLQALSHIKGSDQEYRFWWAYGRVDPEAALSQIDRSDSRNLSMILRGMGSNDTELALSLLEELPNLNRTTVLGGILEGLMESAPARAIELISANNHYDWKHLNLWAARDPQTAFSWILANKHLANIPHRNPITNIMPIMMQKDPDFAAAQIAALPSGQLKSDLLAAQAKELAKTTPQKALALADQYQGETRSRILVNIVQSLSSHAPREALILLEKIATQISTPHSSVHLPDSENQVRLYSPQSNSFHWSQAWTTQLLQEDPEAVMRIATSAATPSDTNISFHGPAFQAFNNWTQLDSAGSLDWLARQPDDPARQALFQSLTRNLYSTPNHRFDQILELSTTFKSGEQVESRIIHAWKRTAPTEAVNFFNSGQGTPAQQSLARQILDLE